MIKLQTFGNEQSILLQIEMYVSIRCCFLWIHFPWDSFQWESPPCYPSGNAYMCTKENTHTHLHIILTFWKHHFSIPVFFWRPDVLLVLQLIFVLLFSDVEPSLLCLLGRSVNEYLFARSYASHAGLSNACVQLLPSLPFHILRWQAEEDKYQSDVLYFTFPIAPIYQAVKPPWLSLEIVFSSNKIVSPLAYIRNIFDLCSVKLQTRDSYKSYICTIASKVKYELNLP